MTRADALARTSLLVGSDGRIDSYTIKLMSWQDYLTVVRPADLHPTIRSGDGQPVTSLPPNLVVYNPDPVWVVGFMGSWYPGGTAGADAEKNNGVVVFNAMTSQMAERI